MLASSEREPLLRQLLRGRHLQQATDVAGSNSTSIPQQVNGGGADDDDGRTPTAARMLNTGGP